MPTSPRFLGISKPTVAKRIRHAVEQHGQTDVAAYREIAKQRYEAGIAQR